MRHDDELRRRMHTALPLETYLEYREQPFLYLGDIAPDDREPVFMDGSCPDVETAKSVLPFGKFVVYAKHNPTVVESIGAADNGGVLPANTRVAMTGDCAYGVGVVPHEEHNAVLFSIVEHGIVERSMLAKGKDVAVVTWAEYVIDFDDLFDSDGMMKLRAHRVLLQMFANRELLSRVDVHAADIGEHMTEVQRVVATAALGVFSVVDNIIRKLCEARDKHLVEVKVVPPSKSAIKKGKAKPLSAENGLPHYVYLDAPTYVRDPNTANKSTGTPKRGHTRRGTWVHLRSPRYKNHPQYGSRIWRRPTWVGPKEWTVGNTIYTLKDLEAN